MRAHRVLALGLSLAALATVLAAAPAGSSAASAATGRDGAPLAQRLVAAASAEGALRHLAAFQRIADASGGHRAAGTPGHERSVRYAGAFLARAGYEVTYQRFTFPYRETAAERLTRLTPAEQDVPVRLMTYTPPTPEGGLTADLAVAGLGCRAADFADGAVADRIALLTRGECTFAEKQANAAEAGALAALIVNDVPGELSGTLGDPGAGVIPTAGLARDDGQALADDLAAGQRVTVRLEVAERAEERETVNLIADAPGREPGTPVVMAGAHLDSVPEGPGINDNGSGAAGLLETAQRLAELGWAAGGDRVRFALWSAEESGLLGSEHYVATLSEAGREEIALYLNFDMIASPNYGLFVYDGDDPQAPPGSAGIAQLIEEFFAARGLATRPTAFNGRSDYGPFVAAGIPAGGTFTGAEGVKTEEEAALWGGTAGEPYDPCYHQACDRLGNISEPALDLNVDLIAHALGSYAAATRLRTERLAR
ncbi:M28 family peptidase [Streptomyces sp. 7-21]|uniref:M28 family peptidase n=1 Tax=Streptomyces sp. 7-21 TaxID=2802283 RepID=UPI0027DDF69D|nr:M28 family peptidase [Streptomyces sp. 7-21]